MLKILSAHTKGNDNEDERNQEINVQVQVQSDYSLDDNLECRSRLLSSD